jgi:hypothetical protein
MPEVEPRLEAPQLRGDLWLNSEPLKLDTLEGRPILILFWDYSSYNCLRAIPYWREWCARYSPMGLAVVGVHSPDFHFGAEPENVERAVREQRLQYPHLLDNERLVRNTYGAPLLPSLFLLDGQGNICYYHFGEGGFTDSDGSIQRLLLENSPTLKLPPLMEPLNTIDRPGAISYRVTRRVELGYEQGIPGNPEGYQRDEPKVYHDSGPHAEAYHYLEGEWFAGPEQIVYTGKASEAGILSLRYTAKDVNLVMNPVLEACTVFVVQVGAPLRTQQASEDVRFGEDGKASVVVDWGRLYRLICNDEVGTHELQLFTASPGLALYSFTFGSSIVPNLPREETAAS